MTDKNEKQIQIYGEAEFSKCKKGESKTVVTIERVE